jgi:hypothetical protein
MFDYLITLFSSIDVCCLYFVMVPTYVTLWEWIQGSVLMPEITIPIMMYATVWTSLQLDLHHGCFFFAVS